jgi:hypothetical protein
LPTWARAKRTAAAAAPLPPGAAAGLELAQQGLGPGDRPLHLGLLGVETRHLGGLLAFGCRQVVLARLPGLAGHLEPVHQVAVLGGQQVEHLDPVHGGDRVVGTEDGGERVAGALDVGGGRPRSKARLQHPEVLLGAGGLPPQVAVGLADTLQRQLALEIFLDQLVGLPVELLELLLQAGGARRRGRGPRAGAARQHRYRQQQRHQQRDPRPSTVGGPSNA